MTTTTTNSAVPDVLSALEGQLTAWNVPGLSVAVVSGGAVAHTGGVGRRRVDEAAPATERTLFHHGSCCKAYTSLLAVLVAQGGELDLDQPARTWVPELQLPEGRADAVTVRDLLSHRSGLSRHDLTWILNPTWTREELVRRLAQLPLAAGLRERMEYSNLGYALAGLVIERVTGQSWDTALRTRVLEPLGMTGSTTSTQQMRAGADAATAHLLRDGSPVPTPDRALVGAAPAGSLMTSAADAAKWLLLQVGASDALPQTAVLETHALAVDMPPGASPVPGLQVEGYGLGWLIAQYKGNRMLWHSGGIDGFATQTFLLPALGAGVTVSANLNGSLLPLAAGLELVDTLADTAGEQNWYDLLAPLAAAAGAPPAPTASPEGAAPPRPVTDLAGRYVHPGYGELTVTADGGGLDVRLGDSPLRAHHVDGDTWEMRYEVLDAPYALSFECEEERVVAAVAPLDPSTGPARFERT